MAHCQVHGTVPWVTPTVHLTNGYRESMPACKRSKIHRFIMPDGSSTCTQAPRSTRCSQFWVAASAVAPVRWWVIAGLQGLELEVQKELVV